MVAIIGILAAIAVPNFLNAQFRAKLARCYSDLKAVQTAIGTYTVDHNWAPFDRGEERLNGESYFALTTPIAYLSSITACRDPFSSKTADSITGNNYLYCDYGAPLRAGKTDSEMVERKVEYAAAGVTYIMVSLGPNRQTDWEWTNWGAGLRALKTPAKAGVNGNGGCFYSISNGLRSNGDIISSSAMIYQ